ncbi:hypothetical protein ElyMa_003898800 [Elysia marginata]|uniref:Uncharacterized protein n=1 Tax=Elysia marginata TaxID=1093978 RepID=A0AAV4FMF7_9GAST|nr:hypothetical protein ElyMa_003898800 [Elysia marginata]
MNGLRKLCLIIAQINFNGLESLKADLEAQKPDSSNSCSDAGTDRIGLSFRRTLPATPRGGLGTWANLDLHIIRAGLNLERSLQIRCIDADTTQGVNSHQL